MPDFTTKLYNRIQNIPEEEWASLFPGILENYHFCKALDDSAFQAINFYYAIFYENQVPIGATTFFLMDFQLDMAVQGWLKFLTRGVKKVFPGLFGVKIVFCGLPMGKGLISISKHKEEVLGMIVECMQKLAKETKAVALVFKDFTTAYDELLAGLFKKGFNRIRSMPSTVMNIDFDNFAGYLKTLSRSSRDGFKRKLKKIAQGPKFNMEVTDRVDLELSNQLHELYIQNARIAEIEFEELPSDFFSNMSSHAKDRSKFFLWRLDGKLVAFAYCLVFEGYFIDYYLGFDQALSHKYNLYFVRFWDLLNWCINNKIKVYEMGQSNYEVKRRLGFEFMPLYAYSKPASKFFIPLFKFYNKFLVFDKFDPVFKKMKKE